MRHTSEDSIPGVASSSESESSIKRKKQSKEKGTSCTIAFLTNFDCARIAKVIVSCYHGH
jgi:hypothetical protein